MMQNSPWNDRLHIFSETFDRLLLNTPCFSEHEYISLAKVLESKAQYYRSRADELLRDEAEVQPKRRAFRRSTRLIANGKEPA